ncbi:hemerythrin domain-containing protein [Magnetospirillum sp. SS-4]|uniref:hemerythrin domain-containing protein n=1 Tax=Magnetospirillum sp. SS-4 TaxID=2681465 RepID=UPI00137D09D4|nr:hemerythrin domain-containing protein [Magnetospirillum sp. SS-4]CAA7622658.1 Response regulator consisting of a CheY-like receiver domain and a winged-helix DNA-binding domain (modular protein) [Magnetospirillum sp. SS-4]
MNRSYENVRLAICASSSMVRVGMKTALYALGFRDIIDTASYIKIHDLLEQDALDLMVTTDEVEGNDVGFLVREMRNRRLGSNPFVVVIMLMSSADADLVKRAADAGANDLLLMPVAPAQVLGRIANIAQGRKPFVVTFDYTGPDRFGTEMQVRNPAPPFMVPNPLLARMVGGTGGTGLQQSIQEAVTRLDRMKVRCSANQIVWLSSKIVTDIRESATGLPELTALIARLVATAEGLVTLLKSVGAEDRQIEQVSALLATARAVNAAHLEAATDVVERMHSDAAVIGQMLGHVGTGRQARLMLTDELRVGHAVIDQDHERLIDIINAFHEGVIAQSGNDVLHQTLKRLLEYGREHFVREQGIQRECNFPEAVHHAKEHADLLAQIKERARSYFVDKSVPVDAKALDDMSYFLNQWLMGHIAKFDLKLWDWVVR